MAHEHYKNIVQNTTSLDLNEILTLTHNDVNLTGCVFAGAVQAGRWPVGGPSLLHHRSPRQGAGCPGYDPGPA